jgi:curved DNA-binding protein CbpA
MIGHERPNADSQRAISTSQTFYELLDVPVSATRMQIREAYIRIKHTYAGGSPALYGLVSDEEAQSMMENAEEAYRVLDDELLRKEYDTRIGVEREVKSPVNQEFGGLTPAELSQVKAPRTLNESQQEPDETSLWNSPAQESQRPRPRPTTTFTKIKKFAAHAFDKDVQDLILSFQSEPLLFDGRSFVQLRELVGVSQAEVQERTKVSLEYIKSLENNDFHKLPSLVYIRGFTKIYLQYLGVKDSETLVEAYTEKYNLWREQSKTQPS